MYIMRRLQQLERRFPRHKFTYTHRGGCKRLYVYPAVYRSNSVDALLRSLWSRATRWRTMRSLHRVNDDLDRLACRIGDHFDRYLGLIESQGTTMPRLAFKDRPKGDDWKAYDTRMDADEKRFNRRISVGIAYDVRA